MNIAYVYDVRRDFAQLCNDESVDCDPMNAEDLAFLEDMLKKHFGYTKSTVAKFILEDFENQQLQFVKVFPRDYKRILSQKAAKATAKIIS